MTWMTPLILTTSDQNTAEVRQMLAAAASAEETAGFTVGQPHEIPGLVAGHIDAGADEVIFSFAFADTEGIAAVAEGIRTGRTVASATGAGVGPRRTAALSQGRWSICATGEPKIGHRTPAACGVSITNQ